MKRPAVRVVIPLMGASVFEARVRDYSRFDHMVVITDHAKEQGAARKITRRMVLRALRKGSIVEAPEWNDDHASWTGKMRYIGSGVEITAVCAIQEQVLVVTVVTTYGSAS